MTVPHYWRRWTRPAALGLAVLMGLLIACGGEEATPTQTATAAPASTLLPTVTSSPTSAPTKAPASTITTEPLSTPSPPVATPVPNPLPTPVATFMPRAAELQLEVTSPAKDAVVTSDSVTVAGLTSPDATVSVNGVLVTPDVQGRFAIDLPMSSQDNPLSIEVIATSVAGERRSVVRTVIFIP
ncbi:MAG: hypothetical protein QF659_06345 [Dehalococcoidia bacterium]|nr:hypothetical protein [Dehalococcoidia bacterium]